MATPAVIRGAPARLCDERGGGRGAAGDDEQVTADRAAVAVLGARWPEHDALELAAPAPRARWRRSRARRLSLQAGRPAPAEPSGRRSATHATSTPASSSARAASMPRSSTVATTARDPGAPRRPISRRARQRHHARKVVAGKHERLLDCAGGVDLAARADLMERVALPHGDEPVEGAQRRRVREQLHARPAPSASSRACSSPPSASRRPPGSGPSSASTTSAPSSPPRWRPTARRRRRPPPGRRHAAAGTRCATRSGCDLRSLPSPAAARFPSRTAARKRRGRMKVL